MRDAKVLASPTPDLAPAMVTSARTRKMNANRRREAAWAYLFITPQVIGLLAFVVFPVGLSLVLCFTKWDLIKPPVFVGLDNFKAVFTDDIFHIALGNTLTLVAGIVPLTLILSLGLALLSNRKLRALGMFKVAFFLPLITTTVAIASVWYWLFAPDYGLINTVLASIGIQGPSWLADPAWAKIAIMIMLSWQSMGYYYLLFLAGLKHIPPEYYVASAIDGASPYQQLIHITMPLLSPTTFFVVTTMLISTFNIFGEVFILTGGTGGPVYSTYTMVMHIYNLAFSFFRMGQAAVTSWVLFAILFVITLVQFRLSKNWVHYGN